MAFFHSVKGAELI